MQIAAVQIAVAQEASADGRRWFDVEVSIFTNDVPGGTRSEFPVARKLSAAYLPRLRELTDRTSALMVEFPGDMLPSLLPAAAPSPEIPAADAGVVETPVATMGPIYSPPVRDSFKLTDFERDAFVDLGTRAAQFTAMNRSIDGAPDHRLLWHKVWRQPLEARAQTAAVFVSGGDERGGHYELEGSLRVVANGTGAMLDINVWLNEFRAGRSAQGLTAGAASDERDAESNIESSEGEWIIPDLPFPSESVDAARIDAAAQPNAVSSTVAPGTLEPAPVPQLPATPAWELSAVWQLAQTRELSANQLYYLDHPALGVLIQVRPYVLPPLLPIDGEEDF
ncbi:MAG TPA: CsiV family protein [Pseudomonadales bacterium]